MPTRIVFLCGIIDDATRRHRHIAHANPAATEKVINICRALLETGLRPLILSLGRGRQNSSKLGFPAVATRVAGIPILYARFVHSPLETHLVSAMSLMMLVLRLRGKEKLIVVAYNRLWHYVPALVVARFMGARCYLDLEDGFVSRSRPALLRLADRLARRCFDALCSHGVLLANHALRAQTSNRHTLVWHGVMPNLELLADWNMRPLGVILSGTLNEERGGNIFIDAIRLLMRDTPSIRQSLRIFITGQGPMCPSLEQLAADNDDWISFEGLVGRERYLQILGMCHVGLMLNLSSSDMSHTTFPSKALEYATAGLLLISTRVSDIPALFEDDGAMLLRDETAFALAEALIEVCAAPDIAAGIARCGYERMRAACDPRMVADSIKDFLGVRA
jgi:glycosyltransferase involved in cell wall biosynthesis